MDRVERMEKLFAGEEVDRPPFTLCFHVAHHHFHRASGEVFARLELQLFDNYRFDFVKVMNDFPYPLPPGIEVIRRPRDLLEMDAFDVLDTPFAHQIRAIGILNTELAGKRRCPFWDTVFNPWFTIRRHIMGDDIYRYMQDHPRELHHALEVVTENLVRYAIESIESGSQGIYLSIPAATEYVTKQQYADFMHPYDEHLVASIRKFSECKGGDAPVVVAHIHGGGETFFEDVARHRPDGISWADQFATPSIEEARRLFDGILMTGIDHKNFTYLPFSTLEDQIRDAQRRGSNRRFILAPGCVIPSHCPERIVRFVTKIATGG